MARPHFPDREMMLRTRYRFARLLVVAALVLCAPILPRAQEIDWTLLNGLATDIGVGPKGEAWVIGAVGEAYGYGIFHFDGANWSKLPGAAVRVAVGPT